MQGHYTRLRDNLIPRNEGRLACWPGPQGQLRIMLDVTLSVIIAAISTTHDLSKLKSI